jgi:cyclopropane-fatty-acyl-phospholipid synthase
MIRRLVPHIESKIVRLPDPVSVQLPQGQVLGPPTAPVKMSFSRWSSLARLKAGQIGALAEDFVEGQLKLEGRMRDVMKVAAGLLPENPVETGAGWWPGLRRKVRALGAHSPDQDAEKIQFHYDVSDDFTPFGWIRAGFIPAPITATTA